MPAAWNVKFGVVPFRVAIEVWPLKTVQTRSLKGPVEVEVNRTASGAGPIVVSMVNAATIGAVDGVPGVLKSWTTSLKSIRPLPLKSNAATGSFAAIQSRSG